MSFHVRLRALSILQTHTGQRCGGVERVLTDRLTNKNGRLTIKNFSSSDAGIYRVLNSGGGIHINLTLTGERKYAFSKKMN